jgi:aryl-alcohol dehydrogenase-like predicted oxidoreductase
VSRLGFGCSSYWANPRFSERAALHLVDRALEGGITYFDTGPSYSRGNAERRLGIALAHSGGDRLVVSTKAGTYCNADGRVFRDWSPPMVRDGLERSLERLRRPRVELLLLHGPGHGDLSEDLVATLADLRRQGLTRYVGINSFDPDVIRHAIGMGTFDVFMAEYNVLKKGNAQLIEEIRASGAGFVAATPLAQTLYRPATSLLPVTPKRAWELARAATNHRDELRTARRYRFLYGLPGMSAAQAALAFVLANEDVDTAVFGTTSVEHLAADLAALDLTLPPDVLAKIQALPDCP